MHLQAAIADKFKIVNVLAMRDVVEEAEDDLSVGNGGNDGHGGHDGHGGIDGCCALVQADEPVVNPDKPVASDDLPVVKLRNPVAPAEKKDRVVAPLTVFGISAGFVGRFLFTQRGLHFDTKLFSNCIQT